jgi:hypothetical protein
MLEKVDYLKTIALAEYKKSEKVLKAKLGETATESLRLK